MCNSQCISKILVYDNVVFYCFVSLLTVLYLHSKHLIYSHTSFSCCRSELVGHACAFCQSMLVTDGTFKLHYVSAIFVNLAVQIDET